MRPPEFSAEVIIQAGQELLAADRKVTGFALRKKVGGGSASRLRQVWDEYITRQSVTVTDPVAELPVEMAEEMAAVVKALSDRIGAAAVELNDRAVKGAERRVRDLVRAAGEQRDQAEVELIDASQTVDDLEAQLEEAKISVEDLKKQLAASQATAQGQAVELAQVRERLALTEQTAKTTIKQHASELDRMNAGIQSDRTRHQHEVEQLRVELAEQKHATQSAAAELAIAKAKVAASIEAHQEQREEIAQMRVELTEQKQTAQGVATELATAKAWVAAAVETHQEQRNEIDQLRTAVAVESKARAAAEQQTAVLTTRMGDINTRAEKFEKQAEETALKLASANIGIQSGLARLESVTRELDEAKKVAETARAAAIKAGEEAAELRGRYAGGNDESAASKKPPATRG